MLLPSPTALRRICGELSARGVYVRTELCANGHAQSRALQNVAKSYNSGLVARDKPIYVRSVIRDQVDVV